MTPALIHKQHRSDERWAGDSPVAAGCARHTSAAREDAQDRPFIRAGLAYRTSGDAPLVRTNSRTAGGRCICEQRRRADRFLPGRPVTQISRRLSIARRAHFICLPQHLVRQDLNAAECHSSSPFMESRSNQDTVTPTEGRNLGKPARQGSN